VAHTLLDMMYQKNFFDKQRNFIKDVGASVAYTKWRKKDEKHEKKNIIKDVGASEHTRSIQKDAKEENAKKDEKHEKNKKINPQRPNHNRKPKAPKQKPKNPM